MASGYILHEDGERVIIATLRSANRKTANMVQVWILAVAESPVNAVRSGSDELICGNCKHRGAGFHERTCYVNVGQGPQSVWRAWQRGSYAYLPRTEYARVFAGRKVRLGAYGDPAFIPLDILRWLIFFSAGHTGYTHQWQRPEYSAWREYVMASVDSAAEYRAAKAAGWRTFRVRAAAEALQSREIVCPASDEAGHRTTCERCGLCSGSRAGDVRKDIAIIVHGVGARSFKRELIQIGRLAA